MNSESRQPIEDLRNEPTVFKPNWAFRQHRQWWAHRAVSFPWFFGCVYGLFFIWGVTHLFHPPTQEATAVKPWRNAQRVSSEALAKEDMLRRVSAKTPEGPRL